MQGEVYVKKLGNEYWRIKVILDNITQSKITSAYIMTGCVTYFLYKTFIEEMTANIGHAKVWHKGNFVCAHFLWLPSVNSKEWFWHLLCYMLQFLYMLQ